MLSNVHTVALSMIEAQPKRVQDVIIIILNITYLMIFEKTNFYCILAYYNSLKKQINLTFYQNTYKRKIILLNSFAHFTYTLFNIKVTETYRKFLQGHHK
jgi:hypothetical protein